MTIRVNLSDGRIVNFPDGTTQEEIKTALSRFTQTSFGVGKPISAAKPDLFSGGNLFMKGLDVLNTPQQAMFGAVKAGIEGKPVWGGAKTGMYENTQFGDVLKSAGMGEARIGSLPFSGRDVAGLTGDILLDPLLGIGKISRGIGLSEKLLSAASKLPYLPKVSASETAVKQIIRGEETAFGARKGRIIKKGEESAKNIETIAQRINEPVESIQRRVSAEIEKKTIQRSLMRDRIDPEHANTIAEDLRSFLNSTADEAGELPPIVQEAAKIKAALKDNLMTERAFGAGTNELDDAAVDYFTHMLTPNAKKLLLKSDPELRKQGLIFNARHGFQLARKYRGRSINELNELARAGQLPGHEGVVIEKFFEDNPALLQTVRLIAGEKVVRDSSIYIGAANQLGKRIDDTVLKTMADNPGRYRKLAIAGSADPRVEGLAGFLKDYVFDADVAKHLDAYWDNVMVPKQATTGLEAIGADFLSLFDKTQDIWKKLTLPIFPAYHSRNVVGNLWNNSLVGIWNPAEYGRAVQFQNANPDKVFRFGNVQKTKGEWDMVAENYRITGQFKEYMNLAERLEPAKRGIGSTLQAPIRAGMKVGNALENNARLTHFFHKLDEGLGPTEAALSVKKYLFDYADLTRFEKAVMRRVIPFYAWTRNNLPLQLRSIVDKPEQYGALGDIIKAVERDRPKPEDHDQLIAGWMKANTAVQVSNDLNGNPEYFLLGGWLPAAEVNALSDPIDMLTDRLSPIIKAPIETLANKSLFFGKDLEEFPGQKEKFLGLELRKKATNALRNLRILTEADRLLAATQKFVNERGTDFNMTTRQGEDVSDAVVRTLFGAKVYAVDVAKQRASINFKRRELFNKARQEVKYGRPFNVDVLRKLSENPHQ